MRISLLEPLKVDKEMIDDFASRLEDLGHTFKSYQDVSASPEELSARLEGVDIAMIANSPLPGSVIEKADQLKMINVAFTGLDHVGMDVAKEKGIDVLNASGYSKVSVAELVIGLSLDLYRKISRQNVEVRKSGSSIMGRELRSKTVGIIGTGEIGLEVARLFQAFGSKLIGYSRTEKEVFKDLGGAYLPLDELLGKADIVTIHLPLNDKTRGFIGEKELRLMKEDGILINCARGPIVDNQALAKLLNEGAIGGAGIDVFDMEPPLDEDYPLVTAKNTILTGHSAYLTEEAMVRRAEIVFDNTLSYLKGEKKNQVI